MAETGFEKKIAVVGQSHDNQANNLTKNDFVEAEETIAGTTNLVGKAKIKKSGGKKKEGKEMTIAKKTDF